MSATEQPAILGGTPIRNADYPSWPVWDDTERAGLLDVLDAGGWWQGDGDQAATFAREFASTTVPATAWRSPTAPTRSKRRSPPATSARATR
jgi:hypothetical protein